MLDEGTEVAGRKPVRRTAEERAAIVAETYKPGATVAGVARKHGMSATRLSNWRMTARRKAARDECQTSSFAKIAVLASAPSLPFDGVEILSGSVMIRLPKGTPSKRVKPSRVHPRYRPRGKRYAHCRATQHFSGAQAAALTGFAPIARDSSSLQGKRSIGGGRRALRHVIFQAALVARYHNPVLKTFADRLKTAGKPAKVIITAVARKLVTIANAICKTDRKWEAEAG